MLSRIHDYFDRRAVMKRLPAVLIDRYGAKASYSDGQVMKALEIANIEARALPYAAAVYMTRDEAIELLEHESVYDRARKSIAAQYYEGDIQFAVDLRGPLADRESARGMAGANADVRG